MNGRLWQVFLYELRRNFRRKGYLFTTFGIPLIAIALLLAYHVINAPNQSSEPATSSESGGAFSVPMDITAGRAIGLVDHAGVTDKLSLRLKVRLSVTDAIRFFPDEAAADAALQAGEIDSYYIVAADYLETGGVTLVLPTLSLDRITEQPIRELLRDALRQEIENEALYKLLVNPSNVRQVNTQRDAPDGAMQDFNTSFLLVYLFVIALLMSLFLTNGYLLQAVIEEKENRVVEILVATVRPMQLLAGKILAHGALGLFQMVTWVAALLIVLQLGAVLPTLTVLARMFIPLDVLPLVLLFFVLAYLLFAAAYGIVGALSTTMREGPQYVVLFTLPAVIPLYFISVFVETPDATLPVVLSLIPITAPLAMVMRLLVTAVPLWQIALSTALLVLSIVLLMWLAGRLFRVQVLLAGQPPRLRDLMRLVRG